MSTVFGNNQLKKLNSEQLKRELNRKEEPFIKCPTTEPVEKIFYSSSCQKIFSMELPGPGTEPQPSRITVLRGARIVVKLYSLFGKNISRWFQPSIDRLWENARHEILIFLKIFQFCCSPCRWPQPDGRGSSCPNFRLPLSPWNTMHSSVLPPEFKIQSLQCFNGQFCTLQSFTELEVDLAINFISK